MSVKLWTEHHLEFLSLKGGCTGLSESTLVKYHIVENHMSRLTCVTLVQVQLSSRARGVSIGLNFALLPYTIRIYHECEDGIEKFIPRITDWHHEACRVMTNGDPEGWIFLSFPHTNNGFFFLLTTVFVILIR